MERNSGKREGGEREGEEEEEEEEKVGGRGGVGCVPPIQRESSPRPLPPPSPNVSRVYSCAVCDTDTIHTDGRKSCSIGAIAQAAAYPSLPPSLSHHPNKT